MKRLYCTLFTAVLLISLSQAVIAQDEWIWRNPLPQGNTLYDVAFINDLEGWAVGGGGIILHTIDGGQNWTIQPGGTDETLFTISFPGKGVAYIAGAHVVLKSTDSGKSWQKLATAPPGGEKIFFIDEKTGWIGASQRIYYTTDGGLTWQLYTMPDPFWIHGLYFVDAQVGFWAGFGGVHKTTDGGKSWQMLWNLPMIYSYHDVFFFDRLKGVAIGSSGTIAVTSDGGVNWTQTAKLGGGGSFHLFFRTAKLGWAIHEGGGIWRTEDGGSTWTRVSDEWSLHGGSFPVGAGYVVGNDGKILKTVDDGNTWQSCVQQIACAGFSSPCFNDGQLAWLAATEGICRTDDGGRSWQLVNTTVQKYKSRLFFVDSQTGWICGDKELSVSEDGGLSWRIVYSHLYRTFSDIHFASAKTGWAIGDHIMKTTDGGQSWVEQPIPGRSYFEGIRFHSLYFIDEQHGWIVGSKAPDEQLAYRTTNGGADWIAMNIPSPKNFKMVRFGDLRNGYILGEKTVYKSSDGGINWAVCYQALGGPLQDMAVPSPHQIRIAAYGTEGSNGVLVSNDGGLNWRFEKTPMELPPSHLAYADADHGLAINGISIVEYTGQGGIPLYPIQLSLVEMTREQVVLSWQDRSDNETGFYIFRSDSIAGRFRLYDSLSANANRFADRRAIPGASHWYRVAAFNNTGRSAWSREIRVDVPLAPPRPPELAGPADQSQTAAGAVQLSWMAVPGAGSYHLQLAADAAFSVLLTDESGLTGTEKNLGSLKLNTVYFWHVRAVNDAGPGAWSETWQFITSSAHVLAPERPMLYQPFDGAAYQPLTLTLAWLTADRAESYQVQVAMEAGFTNPVIDRSAIAADSLKLENLAFNTTFYWRVRGHNNIGFSPWSDVFTFKTRQLYKPVQPKLLLPSDEAKDVLLSPRLNWKPTSGADIYRLQVSTDFTFASILLDSTLSDTTCQLQKLAPETSYYWRVSAANAAGSSPWSLRFSFTTQAPRPEWLPMTSGTATRLRAVWFADAHTGWTVGDSGRILYSNDGGRSWQKQTSSTGAQLRAIHFADAAHGWIAGDEGTVLHSTDQGRSWQLHQSLGSQSLNTIFFTGPQWGWIGGTEGLFRTMDGGATWLKSDAAATSVMAIRFFTPALGWATGISGIYRTEDGGDHWSLLTGSPQAMEAMSVVDEHTVWTAQSYNTICSSLDGGITWKRWINFEWNRSIAFVDSAHGWYSGNAIRKTVDGGASWLDDPLFKTNGEAATNGILFFVGAGDSLFGWSVGDGGSILRTGKAREDMLFTPRHLSPASDALQKQGVLDLRWQACSGAEKYRVQIAGDPAMRTLACDTLVRQPSCLAGPFPGLDEVYWRVQASEAGHKSLWSFPWRLQISSTSDVEKTAQPDIFSLQQNYPNPFNPGTWIVYNLPVPGAVRLTVYDISGKEVACLVDGQQPAGEHKARFEAPGLASGIYLYHLKSGSGSVWRKMMLVR
ncbi:T9SS type A sorting domain-containing protein [bacterium]|nr:T9SS type A sorting domain-containing protein [bacterium]